MKQIITILPKPKFNNYQHNCNKYLLTLYNFLVVAKLATLNKLATATPVYLRVVLRKINTHWHHELNSPIFKGVILIARWSFIAKDYSIETSIRSMSNWWLFCMMQMSFFQWIFLNNSNDSINKSFGDQ
jgi:hypothetical protein